MKLLKVLMCLTLVLGFGPAFAEESTSEKVTDSVHDTKRDVKAKKHRFEEKHCDKSDADCLAKKAGNRSEEAKDAVKDKATETKNKIDN